MAYFPIFTDIKNKHCLVAGAGNVAYRKIKLLLEFEGKVVVVADRINHEIMELSHGSVDITLVQRRFEDSDIDGMVLVIAATDDGDVNGRISELCKEKNIPVNVVDDPEKCSFIMPAIARRGDLVAAFSSGGKSPVVAQYMRDNAKLMITEELSDINDAFGEFRESLSLMIPDEHERRMVYAKLLSEALLNNRVPTMEEAEKLAGSKQQVSADICL